MSPRRYKNNDNMQADAVESWQTIYCSLALIMVVLFVMLISYSMADKRKMTDLRDALKGYCGKAGEIKDEKTGAGSMQANMVGDGVWVNNALHSLRNVGSNSGLERAVTVERIHGGLKLKLGGDVLFPAGSAIINEKLYPYLDEIIKIAREKNLFLKVEGHTDDVPIHSSEFPSNWELSTARAINVLRYFIEKGQFPVKRLTAEGFGQYRPLAPNSTPEGRKQNRRIEVFLELDGKAASSKDRKQ